MSAEERERRDEVKKGILKYAKYKNFTDKILEAQFKGFQERMALSLARDNEPPTISANYFSYLVERNVWGYNFDERKDPASPRFSFPAPEIKYGTPYSEVYLTTLEAKQRPKGIAKDISRLEGKAKASGSVATVQYLLPPGVKRNQKYLAKLWDIMFPGRQYEDGCDEPFAILFPGDEQVHIHECIGPNPDDSTAAITKAANMLGGKEVVLIAVKKSDGKVFLCLDFDKSVDVEAVEAEEDVGVEVRFQAAWFNLLSVYVEWLRGSNVLITTCLRKILKVRKVAYFRYKDAEVRQAWEEWKARGKERVRQAHALRPGAPDHAFKLLSMQLDMVREIAEDKAAEVVVPDKANLDYELVRNTLDDFVRDQRFQCMSRYQLAKVVEGTATKLIQVRLEQLLDKAGESAELFKQLLNAFMTKELVWDNIMPPLKRLKVCEECLVGCESMKPTVVAWVSGIRLDLLKGMKDDGIDVSDLLEGLQL
ncbi:hypothetical protein F4820DRAFT_467786 [Hypoxylon rubiginosum]|uniref:Uncharacterized protein n=1 Tax=Hypoxylon rubiginosum TaxID=110542 RepID=A0ACB9YI15_9PEZI|nr:hypothetical protein F4820DRAFT_467786 [Hypoxylon rubiginosum]